jgi:hypothetical protein
MTSVQRPPRRVLPYVALIAGGVLAGIASLALVELALRLFDINPQGPQRDPFAGFSRSVPMFSPAQRTDGVRVFRVSPGRQLAATRRFKPDPNREFLAEKPPGSYRIVVLGDSSAAGVPYGVEYAFSAWLAKRLAAELPSTRVEVTNAAMPGYATRRLSMIADELVAYAPDLVIVYNGHNEFAESRYYAHLVDMDPRLFRVREWLVGMRLWGLLSSLFGDQQINEDAPRIDLEHIDESKEMFAVLDGRASGKGYASPREREYGAMMYRFNLEHIVRTLRAAGAEVVLLTLSQNFADWAPGASAHREDLSPADLAAWQALVAAGDARRDQGDCNGALAKYREALTLDDHFADLHFRVATCASARGVRRRAQRVSPCQRPRSGAARRADELQRRPAQRRGGRGRAFGRRRCGADGGQPARPGGRRSLRRLGPSQYSRPPDHRCVGGGYAPADERAGAGSNMGRRGLHRSRPGGALCRESQSASRRASREGRHLRARPSRRLRAQRDGRRHRAPAEQRRVQDRTRGIGAQRAALARIDRNIGRGRRRAGSDPRRAAQRQPVTARSARADDGAKPPGVHRTCRVLALSVALVALEVGLRLSGHQPFRAFGVQSREPVMFEADPARGWRPSRAHTSFRIRGGQPDIPFTARRRQPRRTAGDAATAAMRSRSSAAG